MRTALTTVVAVLATTTTITGASAFALGDPFSLDVTGNLFDLGARDIKSQKGICVKDGCKVPGGLRGARPCIYSHCSAEDITAKKNCTIAVGMAGKYEAKCPQNDLPYEWAWPWQPPKKDDGKGK
jgi:hypothetical protein